MPSTPPERSEPRPAPPRLWVPGLLWVSPQGEICAGRHVGYGDDDQEPSLPSIPYRHVSDWTHTAWLVERSALRPALIREHALILPETLIDGDAQPHARRWLAEQPLLCVSGWKVDRLVQAGVRVVRVSFGTAADEGLLIQLRGPGTEAELRTTAAELEAATTRPARCTRAPSDPPPPSPIDRVLRALTGGAFAEQAVVHAHRARCLVQDGYGYHGAPDGTHRSVDDIADEAALLEARFAPIYARAEDQRSTARTVRERLPRAPVEEEAIELPIYGKVWRDEIPAQRLPSEQASGGTEPGTRYVVDGEPRDGLELPAEDRWFADRIEPWRPPPTDRSTAPRPASGPTSSSAAKLAALCVLAALAAIALAVWL